MKDLTDALKNEGDLQENEAEILQHLISNDDARLMGAYDVYAQMQDVDDLVDTMKRIVNRVTGDAKDESDSDSFSESYQPGKKVYEGNDDENDDEDDEIDDVEGEEQDDEIEYSSTSSAFANESHQAVKGGPKAIPILSQATTLKQTPWMSIRKTSSLTSLQRTTSKVYEACPALMEF